MGKRSSFERNPRDYYPTPYEAAAPLIKHLPRLSTFVEPCAGDGRLVRNIERHNNKCVFACDIEPQHDDRNNFEIEQADVLLFNYDLPPADFIITNPPWDRERLHSMIESFRHQALTWLLFDSDWMFTKQAEPYKPYCHKIVTVGRVSWMENGSSGMDNCCWYLFGKESAQTIFY